MTRKRIESRLACLALAGLVILPALGCASSSPEPQAANPRDRELRVRRGTFQSHVLLTGELQAIEADRIVVPHTPAFRIPIRWMEEDGAWVTEGQKVLELDNTQFSGTLEEQRLAESTTLNQLMQKEADISVDSADKQFAVERARITLEKARIDASVPAEVLARREFQERQLALARAEVEHEKTLEELRTAREAGQAELEELRIKLAKVRDELRTAERAIDALILRAPRDGILSVAENRREGRKYQVGDQAWVGLSVMEIPDLSAMKVEATLSDVDDGKIEVGMQARCTLDTYPDEVFTGRVVEITPVASEQGWMSLRRAFDAVIELDTADPERMRPGMSVRVEVLAAPEQEALVAPRAALDFSGEQPTMTLANGTRVGVTLGACNAMECVVEDGPGEATVLRAAR